MMMMMMMMIRIKENENRHDNNSSSSAFHAYTSPSCRPVCELGTVAAAVGY